MCDVNVGRGALSEQQNCHRKQLGAWSPLGLSVEAIRTLFLVVTVQVLVDSGVRAYTAQVLKSSGVSGVCRLLGMSICGGAERFLAEKCHRHF